MDHLIKMILKIRVRGQGLFKLEIKGEKKLRSLSNEDLRDSSSIISDDHYKFKYISLKSLIDSN